MDEQREETIQYEEPTVEDFLIEEDDPGRERRKKRRKRIIRSSAAIIAVVFLISSFSIFTTFFNLPALEFLKTSFQLSQREDIQQFKKAVVAVEGNNIKGTGFNIAADGYIITNYHVIENMKPIVVHFSDGQVYKATVEQGFPEIDVAFLDIKGEDLPVLTLDNKASLAEGNAVFVIGNPLAFYQIANKGELIGLRGVNDIEVPVLGITAPVYRGNSGSPVINEEGKVVGVVFASTIPRVNKGEKLEGLAIPIEEVLRRLP
ncbi:S1C family serine protease [Neobacillus sp. LXY-4]|uniref:S1C family serine protease n=1 Tax=Neobacillus sp. LXY-4 TaxID=3379826 RepID=UPI003EE00BC8